MRTQISVFLTIVLVLGLTGCRTLWNPTSVPSGYAYQNEKYKAPPGPEADSIGYAYSAQANEDVLQIWHVVIKDLVEKMVGQLGPGSKRIYVQSPPRRNVFNSSYDYALRAELRKRG